MFLDIIQLEEFEKHSDWVVRRVLRGEIGISQMKIQIQTFGIPRPVKNCEFLFNRKKEQNESFQKSFLVNELDPDNPFKYRGESCASEFVSLALSRKMLPTRIGSLHFLILINCE